MYMNAYIISYYIPEEMVGGENCDDDDDDNSLFLKFKYKFK